MRYKKKDIFEEEEKIEEKINKLYSNCLAFV